jgi:hypothetical protein
MSKQSKNNLWKTIASVILRKKRIISSDTFRKFFKLPVELVTQVWKKLHSSYPEDNRKHFLWILRFLKTTNNSMNEISVQLDTNEKTLIYNVKVILRHLEQVLPEVY